MSVESIGGTLAALSMAGTVVAWLVKIEGRLMRLETVIKERLPARPGSTL